MARKKIIRPSLGKPTDIINVRIIILKDYLIFYRVDKGNIEVLTIWDSRRNPESIYVH